MRTEAGYDLCSFMGEVIMRVLFYYWNGLMADDVISAMTKMGINIEPAVIPFKRGNYRDDAFVEKMMQLLERKKYDAVFSVHYFHLISYCCHEKDIPYISWEYDSPVSIINPEYFNYETNFCFMFDRNIMDRYRNSGMNRAFYMPLAVNTERLERIPVGYADIDKYGSDISFVGQLYEDDFKKVLAGLPEYSRAYINALCDAQMKIYGRDIITDSVNDEIMDSVNGVIANLKDADLGFLNDTGDRTMKKDVLVYFIEQLITRNERLQLLDMLSADHKVKLYSGDKYDGLKNVQMCGYVDYATEMPKVFRTSKINLNITLRSIESGIPLRCLDILGCRGFLLTNYQSEIAEYFKDGHDLAVYDSAEEACEKADYYLKNNEEREKIAQNGFEKVKNDFSFEVQLQKMLLKTGLGSGGNI